MSPPRSARHAPIRFRPARRTDVERLAELGARIWRVSSIEKRREFYTEHPRFGLRDVRVAELDGQVVGSLVLYPLEIWVRGQKIPMTGIGSVCVSPEHRRRGIADVMMRSTLRELRQKGRALSGLYAWRGSYYQKFGYGVAEYVHEISVSPSNLPEADESRWVRRSMLPDRPAVQALYDRIAQQGHFAAHRTQEWWNHRLWANPGDWIVYEGRRRGQIEGYLYYEVDHLNGPFKLDVALTEFVASTPAAHRGLVGYLATLSDQVHEIQFVAPSDNGWLQLMRSAQNLRPGADISVYSDTGNVANGMMLRINDVKLGLEAFPVRSSARGEVEFEISDPIVPQNSRVHRVKASEGHLTVRVQTGQARSRKRVPRLKLDIAMLGPLVAGTLSPTRAAEIGLIESISGGADIVEPWFRTRPAFLYQGNAF
jgi:predicted acetyltransferase